MPDESIRFSCPCGKSIKAPASAAGRRAKCPACGEPVAVPAAQSVDPNEDVAGSATGGPSFAEKLRHASGVSAAAAASGLKKAVSAGVSMADGDTTTFDQPQLDPETGEPLLWQGSPSFLRTHPGACLTLALTAMASFYLLFTAGWRFGLGGLAFVAIVFGLEVLRHRAIRYKLLESRVSARRGLLSRHVIELRIRDVREVTVSQEAVERILGVGRITLSSAASTREELVLVGVANPQQVASMIRRQQDAR